MGQESPSQWKTGGSAMKTIHFDDPHRQKHFDFFSAFEQPHFNVCASIDVTEFRLWQKSNGLPFNVSMVYFVSRCANEIKEFRWRLRNGRVVEHESIRPSFTVPTEASEVFSFCTVPYSANFHEFLTKAQEIQEKMRTDPSFEDEEGCDDYFFMSSLPWISFTSVTHAMGAPAKDSIPRITWGRLEKRSDQVFMPLSFQAHHAVVDGIHMGRLFQNLKRALAAPKEFTDGASRTS